MKITIFNNLFNIYKMNTKIKNNNKNKNMNI